MAGAGPPSPAMMGNLKAFAMDFSLTPELTELQQRTRAFIRDKIIPLEGDRRQTHHGPTEEFRRELVALAAREGLVAPHVGTEYGGLGLSHVGKAIVFEEAGYSLLGPVASGFVEMKRAPALMARIAFVIASNE